MLTRFITSKVFKGFSRRAIRIFSRSVIGILSKRKISTDVVLSFYLFREDVVPVVLISFGYRLLTLAHSVPLWSSVGLFSVLGEDSVFASAISLSVIGFLGRSVFGLIN